MKELIKDRSWIPYDAMSDYSGLFRKFAEADEKKEESCRQQDDYRLEE